MSATSTPPTDMPDLHDSRTARHVCPLDCPDTCGMVVTIASKKSDNPDTPAEDVAVALRGDKIHPFTRGFLCQKMSHYLERVYHPDRLKHPMRRVGAKGAGKFERISWDLAIATITERFRAIIDSEDGPQAILPYSYAGTMGKIQGGSLDHRFFHSIGASFLDRTICASAGMAGYQYALGRGRLGADPMAVPQCKLIINWGSNTVHTNSHLWSLMVQARKNGARIVTIDPYRSATAQRSDWHIAIKPGTDAALALGIMHILFRDGLQDDDYLAKAATGTELLRERAINEYPPDRVADITGVATEDIETLAHLYGTTQPALIRLNYGMQRHGGGGMAVRVIACLPAITGDWKHHGGGVLLSTSGGYGWNDRAVTRPDLAPPNTRTVNMTQLGEALAGDLPQGGPPVKAIYVYNSNPAAIAPNSRLVRQGLLREDLFTVVHDLFLTDTADYADIVLPATSQLEHEDVHGSYGHHYVMYNAPSLAPQAEARSNNDVFRALAAGMGLDAALFPDDGTLIDIILNGGPALAGITLQRLKSEYTIRLALPEPYLPFADGEFPTPSGRCELFSESLREIGMDPLPTYVPPHEDPKTRTDLSSRYPLQLLSPPRASFLNSTFANHKHHRRVAGAPTVELALVDAVASGVKSGEWAIVHNDRGQFAARVEVSDGVRPGVAVSAGIYWNKFSPDSLNVNSTTPSALTDLGGGATFFDNLVAVRPAYADEALRLDNVLADFDRELGRQPAPE